MNSFTSIRTIGVVGLIFLLGLPTGVFGEDSREMVNQALDLVHQAQDQSNDQRTGTLKQALELLGNETTHFHGHVGKAMKAIRAALRKIKAGDTYGTAGNDIQRADDELRAAMSIAT